MLEDFRKTLRDEADALAQKAMIMSGTVALVVRVTGRATPVTLAVAKTALRDLSRACKMYFIVGMLDDEETIGRSTE